MTRPRVRSILDKLDSGVYRGHSQAGMHLTPLRENQSNPYKLIDKSHALRSLLVLLILIQMAIPMPSYAAGISIDALRLYAHSRLTDFTEFMCFDSIIISESHYNYLARNGNHYGIGQMESKTYQSRDPYTQIDLTIRYVRTRYKTMCNALTFHKKHGYY